MRNAFRIFRRDMKRLLRNPAKNTCFDRSIYSPLTLRMV